MRHRPIIKITVVLLVIQMMQGGGRLQSWGRPEKTNLGIGVILEKNRRRRPALLLYSRTVATHASREGYWLWSIHRLLEVHVLIFHANRIAATQHF